MHKITNVCSNCFFGYHIALESVLKVGYLNKISDRWKANIKGYLIVAKIAKTAYAM